MSAGDVHVNDIGTIFRLTIYDGTAIADISSATVKQVIFYTPGGSAVIKTADFTTTGADGQIQYTAGSADITESGLWRLQGRVTTPTGTWTSTSSDFRVFPNLDE